MWLAFCTFYGNNFHVLKGNNKIHEIYSTQKFCTIMILFENQKLLQIAKNVHGSVNWQLIIDIPHCTSLGTPLSKSRQLNIPIHLLSIQLSTLYTKHMMNWCVYIKWHESCTCSHVKHMHTWCNHVIYSH